MAAIGGNSGSSTCVIELQPPANTVVTKPREKLPKVSTMMDPGSSGDGDVGPSSSHGSSPRRRPVDAGSDVESPAGNDDDTRVSRIVEKWNEPRINMYRTFATFWSFVILGANDAATGALIPYLESYYGLTYTVVSLIFLSPFVGYAAASVLNNALHVKLGQRGIGLICSGCHILSYAILAAHPPYPVLVVSLVFTGFGNGLADSGWNAWVANLANANEVLGFLHGFYGLGAVLSPLIATSMIVKAGFPWYSFYYLMTGGSVIELVVLLLSFWKANKHAFRKQTAQSGDQRNKSQLNEALLHRPGAGVSWLCAAFFLGYVGVEVSLGGWIVVFMMRVRHGGAFESGMTATGFWIGITVGRLVLGFVTPRIGERLAISIYLVLTMALELVFWLVPQFYVSAVAVSVQGFFLGPLFPGAVVMAAKLLPVHLHVASIGFASAVGGIGAAVLPFAVGAIAQTKGVQVLQPIVLAILAFTLCMWLLLPRLPKKRE